MIPAAVLAVKNIKSAAHSLTVSCGMQYLCRTGVWSGNKRWLMNYILRHIMLKFRSWKMTVNQFIGVFMRRSLKLIIALSFVFSISACSTIEGIGKDLKKGGTAIQNAAKS